MAQQDGLVDVIDHHDLGKAAACIQDVADFHRQGSLQVAFAGAVLYTKYDFVTRMVMKKISASEGHSTDTSRDHEYTDWGEVAKFTDEYLDTLTE